MTPRDFMVRDVAPGDLDPWRKLWDGYNAFYERVGPTALPALWRESYGGTGGFRARDAVEVAGLLPRFLTSRHHDVPALLRQELPDWWRPHLVRQAARLVPSIRPGQFREACHLLVERGVHVALAFREGAAHRGRRGVTGDWRHLREAGANPAVHVAFVAWADLEQLDGVANGRRVELRQAGEIDGH